jgi:hypothetical protein
MAVPALVAHLGLQPAMEALVVFDIAPDVRVVMAGKTTLRLIVFFQGLVALFAILFEGCMTFDQISRHQQHVETPGSCRSQIGEAKDRP